MKQYTLIKMYPGSPEIGSETKLDERGQYVTAKAFGSHILQKEEIESFPEFWQEKEADMFINVYTHGDCFLTQIFYDGNEPQQAFIKPFKFKGTYKLTKI